MHEMKRLLSALKLLVWQVKSIIGVFCLASECVRKHERIKTAFSKQTSSKKLCGPPSETDTQTHITQY